MVRIISALILAATAACAFAQENPKLVDNPPDRHIVVSGDTLWGISGKFMKDPWRWPDLWQLNKEQIKNPHRIYPGDVIVFDHSADGKPRLRVATRHHAPSADAHAAPGRSGPNHVRPQVYSEPVQQAISSIPPGIIEPFISRPLIIAAGDFDNVPRIIATQENRVLIGSGDTIYVNGVPDASVVDWNIYRPGKPLKDPDTGEILGYEAFDLGNAKLIQPGTPAVMKVISSREEIIRGERLAPTPKRDLISYVPHAPEQKIAARVMSIYGGVSDGGKYSVITINRGTRDGIEVGHVLALNRRQIANHSDDKGKRVSTPLPDNRYGLSFVFRTFERVSYVLVMESSLPVVIGDALSNP